MKRDANAYILDIRENSDLILGFVAGSDLDLYKASDLLKSAVERRFIVIGEALSRLKQMDLGIWAGIPDAARIVAFRNVLVHGYESISDELVWDIIHGHLPNLRARCDELLSTQKDEYRTSGKETP
jgi:uncharacterized protein with HEPN domain